MIKWCPTCKQYTNPFVFQRLGREPHVLVCNGCGGLFNEEAMPDNPEHYDHKKNLHLEHPKSPRRPMPKPVPCQLSSTQRLLQGMTLEIENLRGQLHYLKNSNVTHYCATCETLAKENEQLQKALDVAVDGLQDLRETVTKRLGK